MNRKSAIFALALVCVFAALSFAATDSGEVAVVVAVVVERHDSGSRQFGEQIILDIVKDVEQLKSKLNDNNTIKTEFDNLKNKVLEDKNSWLNTLQAKLSFLVGILTIVVAGAAAIFPYWLNKREGELARVINDAKGQLGEIEGAKKSLNEISSKSLEEAGRIRATIDELDKMATDGKIDVNKTYQLSDEELKKVNGVLESPMAPFGLYLQAAALKCMAEHKYERAVWFWETLGDLGERNKNDEALAICHYQLGNEFYSTRNYEEAIKRYKKSNKLKKGYHEALNNWGVALSKIATRTENKDEAVEKFEEACKKYEEAIAMKKDKYQTWSNWGDAISNIAQLLVKDNKKDEAIKKFEEAFPQYDEAIRLKDDFNVAWYNLSNALAEYLKLPLNDEKRKLAGEKRDECLAKINKIESKSQNK